VDLPAAAKALLHFRCRTIAAATGQLARAARPGSARGGGAAGGERRSRLRAAVAAALTPLQPTLVTALEIAVAEARAPRWSCTHAHRHAFMHTVAHKYVVHALPLAASSQRSRCMQLDIGFAAHCFCRKGGQRTVAVCAQQPCTPSAACAGAGALPQLSQSPVAPSISGTGSCSACSLPGLRRQVEFARAALARPPAACRCAAAGSGAGGARERAPGASACGAAGSHPAHACIRVSAAPWHDSPRGAAAHRRHLAAGALGLACFALEDAARERAGCGWAHAAWHCLACASVSGYNALLAAQEAAAA